MYILLVDGLFGLWPVAKTPCRPSKNSKLLLVLREGARHLVLYFLVMGHVSKIEDLFFHIIILYGRRHEMWNFLKNFDCAATAVGVLNALYTSGFAYSRALTAYQGTKTVDRCA